MVLREKLIVLRDRAGLSQLALAETLGISRQAVSRWESGNSVPSIENLKAMAGIYGVSLDWLCSDSSVWPLPEAEPKTAGSEPSTAPEQTAAKPKAPAKKWAVILICAFMIAAAIFFCIANSSRANVGTPISALPSEDVTDNPEENFSFEW